jgi:hypothetical protein
MLLEALRAAALAAARIGAAETSVCSTAISRCSSMSQVRALASSSKTKPSYRIISVSRSKTAAGAAAAADAAGRLSIPAGHPCAHTLHPARCCHGKLFIKPSWANLLVRATAEASASAGSTASTSGASAAAAGFIATEAPGGKKPLQGWEKVYWGAIAVGVCGIGYYYSRDVTSAKDPEVSCSRLLACTGSGGGMQCSS